MLAVIGAPHLAASGVLRRNFEVLQKLDQPKSFIAPIQLVVSSGQLVWSYSTSVLALSLLSIMLEFTSPEWPRITHSLKNIFQVLPSVSVFSHKIILHMTINTEGQKGTYFQNINNFIL